MVRKNIKRIGTIRFTNDCPPDYRAESRPVKARQTEKPATGRTLNGRARRSVRTDQGG
jgi:hypothetical protein